MNKKLIHKWIMYHEIHKRRREGFRPAQISRDLGLDKRTVRKYLSMNEKEYRDFIHNQKNRKKLLDPYEDFVKPGLRVARTLLPLRFMTDSRSIMMILLM